MSTRALAVSTCASGWLRVTVSPSCTSHSTSCASSRPSPRSGSRNWLIGLILLGAVYGFEDAVGVGQEELFDARGGIGDGGAADTLDGGGKGVEEVVHEAGGDLGADAHEDGGLVDDDGTLGLADGGGECVHVERGEGAQVHDFERDAFGGGALGGGERNLDGGAIGDDGGVGPCAGDAGAVERDGRQR